MNFCRLCSRSVQTCHSILHRTSMQGRRTSKPEAMMHRANIIWMWASGRSVRDIARENSTSITTVYRWIRRWNCEGTIDSRPRTGRPRITTVQEDAAILAAAHTHPDTTAADIRRYLQPRCSLKTIQRRIHERHLHQSALVNRNCMDAFTYGGRDDFVIGNHVVQYHTNAGLNENNFMSVTSGNGYNNTFSRTTNGSDKSFWSQNMGCETTNRYAEVETCKVNYGMWSSTHPRSPALPTYQN